eukprot:9504435-Karenia_brevis.AAC.1
MAAYRKPSFKPQYLSYMSAHSFSARMGILAGEQQRLLVLNSTAAKYLEAIKITEDCLLERGYPKQLLETKPYDAAKREELIAKYQL